jgi:hypothetical protein
MLGDRPFLRRGSYSVFRPQLRGSTSFDGHATGLLATEAIQYRRFAAGGGIPRIEEVLKLLLRLGHPSLKQLGRVGHRAATEVKSATMDSPARQPALVVGRERVVRQQ